MHAKLKSNKLCNIKEFFKTCHLYLKLWQMHKECVHIDTLRMYGRIHNIFRHYKQYII